MPAASSNIIEHDGLTLVNSGDLYKDQLIIMLEQVQMFDDFTEMERNTLANYLKAYQAEKDTVIYREGDCAGHMCLLIEGQLEVYKDIDHSHNKKLAEIRPGKSIGEMSVIDGLPNSATVIVSQPSVLIVITRKDLQLIAQNHPPLGIKLLWYLANLLSQRLRYTSGRLIDRL
jgi:CRP-like cAMP-binding protein